MNNPIPFKKIEELVREIEGTGAVVIKDLSSGHKFDFREDEVFPIASLIKLTILWELFVRIEKGEISLSDFHVLSESDKVGGFGVLKELHEGLTLTIEDIAKLMIILSDNVATNILIDKLGMEAINETSQFLGLKDTKLQRKMMDADAKARGLDNYSTAVDVARILELYATSDLLSKESRNKMIDILKRQQCNNKFPRFLPEDYQLAHKTGDLPGTEHDAAIFEFSDRKVITVVLTKDLKDNEDGVKLCNDIGKLIYDAYASL